MPPKTRNRPRLRYSFEPTERYGNEMVRLVDWFSDRLPDFGHLWITDAQYRTGLDALPLPYTALGGVACVAWEAERDYCLDRRQIEVALFSALRLTELMEVSP